jgi:hypothetical protein
MAYLLLGLFLWLAYTYEQVAGLPGAWGALRPVSLHFITVGWLSQLIFAVMYWMFPIINRQNPYGKRWLAWFGAACLNLGLLARAFFEIGLNQGLPSDAAWGLIGAALLQWGGAGAWMAALWPRVRERGGK